MAYCYDDCEDYAVTPMFAVPCAPMKCSEVPPLCYPCLPRCSKKVYQEPKPRKEDYCCKKYRECVEKQKLEAEAPRVCKTCCPAPHSSAPVPAECCYAPCKPVKTKYIIPCYRYEDGRIVNQPTVLTRRACEVAVGARPRRKPFITQSYSIDSEHEVHRYVAEDEKGNCCYHFEKKNKKQPLCPQPTSYSQPHCCYDGGVRARPIEGPKFACFYS